MVKAPNFYAIFKQRLERLTAGLVLASLVGGGVLGIAPAQVLAATGAPSLIHHQGRLFDTSGNLLGGSGGTDYCFKFSFYDDATVGGPDTKLWPTGAPSTMTVEVKNGVFGVNIGDTGAGGDLLDFDFESTDEAYLNVEVAALVGATCAPGDGVEVFDNLDPRQRVVSAGYAINANTLGGFSPAQSASGSDIPVLTADDLILGGSDPEITATGTNLLTLQSGSTGNIEFFSSMNTLDASGNLSLDGVLTATDLTLGTIAIGDTGVNNTTSGASLVGIFDEFTNSNATTVQAAIKDLDTAIVGAGSKWTDAGSFTYLTSVTDDLVIGATSAAAGSLFFDESAGELDLGTDNSLNGTLKLYSSGVATPDVTLAADSSGNLDLTAVELTLTGNASVSGTLTAGTVDINGGAIDGTAIGASVASTGAFTTLSSTGVTTLGNNSATVAVNSSDWDITSTGTITGVDFDANGSGNSITNIDNADLSNDTVDFDKIVDAATLDAATSITGAAGRSFTVARALTDAASENGIIFNLTASDSTSGTTNQFGLYLDNLASTEGLDASFVIDNSDTDDAVGAAIKIVNAGGGFTNLIDNAGVLLSSSEVNLLDGGIAISELTDSGTFTAASVDINGGAIDGTTIGATVASTGAFTTLSSTGATTLGNNSSTVAIDSTTWDISAAGVVTLAATTGQTTAIDITDTDYTNAFSIGDNNILGTTAAIDFTNFDVSTGGNITVAAGVGLDTNAAGALALGNTNATSLSACNSAACDTISLGTNADADSITIGESANDTVSIAGSSLSLVIGGTTVSGTEITVLDGGIALSELTDSGTLTAGTVDINGGAIDGTAIGASVASTGAFTTLSSTGVTTIGNNSATVAVNSSDWDISATGVITGVDFDANGTGNSISNIESADILDATITGDDIASSIAGTGLVLTAASPDHIDVVSANGGIVVNADNIALTVAPSADALSSTTSAGSGLEILTTGVAMLQGCANNEILKWSEASDVWSCSADSTGGGAGTLDDVYTNGGTIAVDTYDLLLNLTDATNDYHLTIDNTSTGTIGTGIGFATTGSGAVLTVAVDASDADIVTALAIGSNDVTVGGATLSSSELALLDAGVALNELTDSGTLTATTVDINGGAIDGTTIGASVASSGSFTTLASTGVTTIGNNSATVAVNSSSWDISSAGVASGFTGLTTTGNITVSGAQILGASPFVFEGATDDDITTTFVITDPTSSNKTITFQNGSGTVAFLTDTLSSTLTDNISDALDIQEGTNNYININTTNASENIAFGNATTNPSYSFLGSGAVSVAGAATVTGDVAVNGGDLTTTSATFNLLATNATTVSAFDAATTLNLNDAAVTSTIDIGGVTNSGTNTINIATNGTAADGITIGNSNASTTVAITGGDDWSITGAGVLSMTASAAATTAIVITDTDYTNALSIGDNNILGTTAAIDFTNFDVSTGGNITVAAGVGLDTNAAGALAIGNTNATSLSACNSAACDTISLGTNADADTITIGDASDSTSLNSANWSIATTGNITTAGDAAVNGGDLTSSSATFNLLATASTTINAFDAATTLNLNDAAVTSTIDIGGVTSSGTNTINVATNGTAADTITIGNSNASTTVAITGGDDWSMTGAGVLTMSASAAATTAIVVTDTDYTNALSIGDNNILGTTAAIDFTNFDVSTGGNITVAAGVGLDTNAAGALAIGNTNATSVSLCNSAACDTITVGSNADADTITIGDAASDTTTLNGTTVAIDSGSWDVSSAGVASGLTGLTTTGNVTVSGAQILGASPFVFEGATDDDITTTFVITDPTSSNKTITFQNGSGTVAFLTDTLSSTLTDNISDALDIQEGTNNYININTTNASENIAFGNATTNPSYSFLGAGTVTTAGDVAINGGDLTSSSATFNLLATASTTINAFDAATTTNINDAAVTSTIDIGGVTSSGTNTINIATNGTAADGITIGNSNAGTTVAITGGDDWSITGAGVLSMTASAAATTAVLITDTDYTNALSVGDNNIIGTTGAIDYTNFDVSTGGNITVAAGVGLDTNAAGALAIGNTNATSISECNSAACDTYTLGTNADADTITIGDASDSTSLNSANWSIATTGNITTAGDAAINGGDLTSSSATFNLLATASTTINAFDAATTTNINDAAVTSTIDIGGVTSSGTNTINVATNGTAADTITIGNSNAGTTVAITGGDDWSMTGAGVLTMSASAAATTAIVVTDTDYTNALSIGDNNILGTTAAIDFTNFDVSTGGNITVAAGVGLDTNAAGALAVGNTNATSVSICNSAACDTILIGNNADADTITIGDSTDTAVSITDDNWSFTTAGLLTQTATLTNTSSIQDVNLTLGNDADADTVSGINIDVTSAATGDADIVYGLNVGDLTTVSAVVTESAIRIGANWENAIDLNGTLLTAAEIGILDGGVTLGEITSTITDNVTDAYDLQEGTNNYININTTNAAENISFGNATTNPTFSFLGAGLTTFSDGIATTGDAAINGGDLTSSSATFNLLATASTTINAFDAATTTNINDAAVTSTIDIGGVTSSGTNTINIATNGTAADGITIGNSNAGTTVAITGGDDWSITGAGVLSMTASAAATTAVLITDTDYTNALSVGDNNIIGTTGAIDYTNFDVSTGGNITVAAGVGLDTNAAGALALGNTNATSLSACNSAACDTISLGTNADADTITIGDASDSTSLNSANWSIATTGNITTAGDAAINGGDLTSSSATFNLLATASTTINAFDAATTTNINDAAVTSTIDIGGVTSSGTNTINIATNGTAADGITIGNTNASTTLALTGGDDWSMTGAGVLTMSASAAATTAIVVTDTDYTNALSVGDNNIIGTTGAIDYTNFDVSTTGDITLAGGDLTGANSAAIDLGEATTGAITFTAGTTGDYVFSLDNDSNATFNATITGTSAIDLVSSTITNQTTSGTQRGLVFTNANDAANAVTESLIFLDNAETTASTLTDAILITSSGVNDGVTDAIDASAANITNAINIGANAIAGTNFSVTGAGVATATGITSSGTITFSGLLSCNALSTNGSGTVACSDGPDTASFEDTSPAAWNGDNNTTELWDDATRPNIVVTTATSTVLVSVHVTGNASNTNNDLNLAAQIAYDTGGADPTCGTDPSLGNPMNSGFATSTTEVWTDLNGTFVHDPGVAAGGTAVYTLCSSTDSAGTTITDTASEIDFTLVELGADLAENYYTNDPSLKPGDVVEIDPNLSSGVRKSANPYGKNVIGVISTLPGLVMNDASQYSADGTVQVGDDGQGKLVPVALAGRIPVYVSRENGDVKIGDYLTASSVPGVAMKATKSGLIIGQALSDYNSLDGEIGMVAMFVKNAFYNGGNLSEQLTAGLDASSNLATSSQFLQQLMADQADVEASLSMSDIATDRLTAGLEIITPKLVAGQVQTDTLAAATGSDLSIALTPDGHFKIGSAVTIDAAGNATFAGTLTAASIAVENVTGLTSFTDEITVKLEASSAQMLSITDELKAGLSALAGRTLALENLTSAQSQTLASLSDRLTALESRSSSSSPLTLDTLGSVGDSIRVFAHLDLIGRPYFNNDTAGFAVIKAGDQSARVTFSEPYLTSPIVNASVTFDAVNDDPATATDESLAASEASAAYLSGDLRFVVADESVQGFSLKLSKPVNYDVRLSWTALAVNNPHTFWSSNVTPEPIVLPVEPEVIAPVEDVIVTPEPEVISEPELIVEEPVVESEPEIVPEVPSEVVPPVESTVDPVSVVINE